MAQRNKQEEQFETMLRREVAGAATPQPADCPGPELLAAYYDRSLSREERAQVDSHLLGCARCQSTMALIARAESAAGASDRLETAGAWRWLMRHAPIATASIAAIALIVVLAVRNTEQPATQPMTLAMRAPIEQPAVAPPAVPAAAPPAAENEAARLESSSAPVAGAPAIAPSGEVATGSLASAQNSLAQGAPARDALAKSALAPATTLMSKAGVLEIYSPDRSVTWRIVRNGMILQTRNGVAQLQRSGVTTEMLAGSAPSNDVCWMVGRSGVVLRTIDGGGHWTPATAPGALDLIAVDATGADRASVTAANGDRFSTRDGGKTWTSP